MSISSTTVVLGGSDDGAPILIDDTISGGAVVIHTALGTANQVDHVRLSVANLSTDSTILWLGIDGIYFPQTIPGYGSAGDDGLIPVAGDDDIIISGSLVIDAYASIANNLVITGKVTRVLNS